MDSPGLVTLLRRAFVALCLLLVSQVSSAIAGNVRLYWDANSEADLAGYVLVWGTSPGVYTDSTTVAAGTLTHEVTTLPDGTWYFAVRAFNNAGLQSTLSNEVMVVVSTSVVVSAPSISATTPASGSTAGGTDVTITGSDFASGVVVSVGGTAATVLSQTATTIVARTPAGPAGTVGITVTNPDGGTTSKISAFTYQAPVSTPTISGVTPTTGTTAGNTSVTITGTNFQSGAVVRFGATTGTVTSLMATSIVVKTPAQAAGAVAVTVQNPDGGSAQAAQSFTYQTPVSTPTVTSVSPTSGSTAGNTSVTLTGTNFQSGAVVRFGAVNGTVTSLMATSIVVKTPAQAAGAVSVTVQNPDGGSAQASQSFTYQAPAPTVTAVSPTSGPTAGNTSVTITGTNFQSGAVVRFGGVNGTVTSLMATSIVVKTPAQAAGAVTVTVQNPDGGSAQASQSFTYQAPAPTVTAVSPTSGPTAGNTSVTITGTNFQNGAVVRFGGVNGTVTSLMATSIVVKTPAQAAGAVTVTVQNPDGGSAQASQSFTYQSPAPTVTVVSPTSGPTAGNTSVTITGTNFQSGAVVRFSGSSGTVTSVTATSIVVKTPARSAGAATVTVQNPDGATATASQSFTYQTPSPTLATVAPLVGSTVGGTVVTLSGTNFQVGAVVRFGSLVATVTNLTSTQVVVSTPAQAASNVAVTLTNPDGGVAQAPTLFAVQEPAGPTVTSFAPALGTVDGGTDVTITGANYASGVVVSFGSKTAQVLSRTATRLIVRTPAQAKGIVDLKVQNADGRGVLVPKAFTYRGKAPAVQTVSPTSGTTSGGSDVTIDGADFEAGVSVSINNLQATVLSVTPTRLTVRMPAHAPALVGLTITNPDSQLAWVPAAYNYVSEGPAVTHVEPESGPTAGGTSVTIVGSGFASDAIVKFDGIAATVVSRTSEMLTVIAPAHAAAAVSVLVQNGDGLSTTRVGGYTYADPETFVRYFAEGASGSFFRTRFAVANPHSEPVTVTVTFTDTMGTPTSMDVTVPALARVTLDESNRPVLASEAFATKFECARVIGVERTMTWAAGGPAYGAHSETGVAAPRTSWTLAEGATIAGFNTFYLLQNPTTEAAQVKVQYLLATGERVEKVHPVAPLSRTNIWVNKDDPKLEAAEMSATLTSLNGVPVVVERSMYRNSATELFAAGHNSAAVEAPALRWFLAEGATGGTFDEFVLIANPNASPATLKVSFLRAGQAPIVQTHVAPALSRLTLWVDEAAPELASAEVSVVVESVTPTPVVVERSMWWRATPTGEWVESHNSRGATSTAPRWVVSDGEAGGAGQASTYVLVANTSGAPASVRFTLLPEKGTPRTIVDSVSANGRFSLDVAAAFPEAAQARFSVLVESVSGNAPLVVERASYSSTPTTTWASGTAALAMPLP